MRAPSNSQLKAIKHLRGPAEIIAGPGSGKTFTIIKRILYLIEHYQISPEQILVITFTKAAALEMQKRYEEAVSKLSSIQSHVRFGTFHSICYYILKQSGNFSADSLLKDSDKRKIISIILANHGYEKKCNYELIDNMLSEISRQKNIPDKENYLSVGEFSSEEFSVMKEEYQQQLEEQGKLDFDDMIGKCLELLVSHPEILSKYRNQFRYLMVDEFQDINMPQYNVVKLLAGEDANLLVVGDDDQAIYGFRGASPGVMKRFQEDFPNCTQIMLTENYRSGQEIVKLAGKVIDRNKERFSKEFIPIRKHGEISFYQLESRKEEEERLIRDICVLTDEVINNSALILRTNREVFQYRELLKASGVKVKEIKPNEENIFRSFMVEDISAYLNFLYRGQKRSDFLKFMNKPNHYFTRLALLHETVNEEDMFWYYYQNETMKRTIRGYFKHLSLAKSLSPYMAVSLFRKTLGYERYIREKSESYMIYENWLKQLDKLQELLKDYGNNIDAEQFFRDLEDKQGKSERSEEKRITQGISVITMHGAKGLEFEHVFLPDVNEGIIPSKNCREASEVEEERRLLYVAITRARDSLHIYATKERNRKPSSFLNGIILPQ